MERELALEAIIAALDAGDSGWALAGIGVDASRPDDAARPDAIWGVECPLCHRRVVTTEAPCECGFRFPRGYGARWCPNCTRCPAASNPGIGCECPCHATACPTGVFDSPANCGVCHGDINKCPGGTHEQGVSAAPKQDPKCPGSVPVDQCCKAYGVCKEAMIHGR